MKKTNIIFAAVLFLTLISTQAKSVEANKESCLEAISDLGFPVSPYEFKDGWLFDKHIFGGTVECSEESGYLLITSNGEKFAEDGFFGLDSLAARDKILSTQSEEKAKLKEIRDNEVKAIREIHDVSVASLEKEIQLQLQQVREQGIPSSLIALIEIERTEREAAEKAAAEKRAARDAEKEQERSERVAKRAELDAAKSIKILEAEVTGLDNNGQNNLLLTFNTEVNTYYQLAYTINIKTRNDQVLKSYQYQLRTRSNDRELKVDLMDWLLPSKEDLEVIRNDIRPGNIEWMRIKVVDQSVDFYKEIADQQFTDM